MNTPGTAKTSLRDFLHLVFKRRTQILLFFSATFCIVAVATVMAKPKYEATSEILVKIGREDFYALNREELRPVVSVNGDERVSAEIEILKSRSLAEKGVELMGPMVIYEDLKEEGYDFGRDWAKFGQARRSPILIAVLRLQRALEVEALIIQN